AGVPRRRRGRHHHGAGPAGRRGPTRGVGPHQPRDRVRARVMTSIPPIYDRDGITIYNADCRDVLAQLNPADFAVMLTDPPDGMAYRTNSGVSAGARQGWRSLWADTDIANDRDTTTRDTVLHWWGDRP